MCDLFQVCGSDGHTYANPCLVCAKMGQTNAKITIVSDGKCVPQ